MPLPIPETKVEIVGKPERNNYGYYKVTYMDHDKIIGDYFGTALFDSYKCAQAFVKKNK